MIRGSSRIIILGVDVVGNPGPTGATGSTGPTGNFVTGPNGPNGKGITGITFNPSADGVTFYVDGISPIFLTGIKGNTGDANSADFPLINYLGDGIAPLQNEENSSGYTLFFRSITFSSRISASISGETILIGDNSSVTGSFDPNKLLFVDYSSNSLQYYLDSGNNASYSQSTYNGISYSSLSILMKQQRDLLNQNNLNYSYGANQNTQHPEIQISIDACFYGMTGTENSLSENSWNPYLKFRSSYFHHSGTSGATSGILSFEKIGPFTKRIAFDSPIGSCCFYCGGCEGDNFGRVCIDYVSQAHCNSLSGRWSSSTCCGRQNTYDCYLRGACCIDASCINTTSIKCSQLGGTFCSLRRCGDPEFTCGGTCSDYTPIVADVTCCCTNGIARILGAGQSCAGSSFTSAPEECTDQKCCQTVAIRGACCRLNGECQERTIEACDGTFMGQGTTCGGVTCCAN